MEMSNLQHSRVEETRLSELATEEQINTFVASFADKKARLEAFVFGQWLLTDDIWRLVSQADKAAVKRGEDPPDFVISTDGKGAIAIEVTTFVTERKIIYDKASPFPGPYTSTLRRTKADAAFHKAVKKQQLPDDSWVRPHFENLVDLDNDYYETMEAVLRTKIADAKQYSPLYGHTVVLIEDSLSEFEPTLERRLPRLRNYLQSLQPTASVEVVVMNTGKGRGGIAHRL